MAGPDGTAGHRGRQSAATSRCPFELLRLRRQFELLELFAMGAFEEVGVNLVARVGEGKWGEGERELATRIDDSLADASGSLWNGSGRGRGPFRRRAALRPHYDGSGGRGGEDGNRKQKSGGDYGPRAGGIWGLRRVWQCGFYRTAPSVMLSRRLFRAARNSSRHGTIEMLVAASLMPSWLR